jgi:hypothetical protein
VAHHNEVINTILDLMSKDLWLVPGWATPGWTQGAATQRISQPFCSFWPQKDDPKKQTSPNGTT